MNSVLQHLGQAAAAILLLELLVVLLMFLGISGGLAFGFHWLNGKTDPAFNKANTGIAVGRRYLRRATDLVALPFIKVSKLSEEARATARALRADVLQHRTVQPQLPGRPVAPSTDAGAFAPAVDDARPVDIP